MSGPPNGDHRAASPSTDSPNGGALDIAAWAKESDTVEERFVSALLGTTRWLGRICMVAQANAENVFGRAMRPPNGSLLRQERLGGCGDFTKAGSYRIDITGGRTGKPNG